MKLTNMKGGEVYVAFADVARVYNTGDHGAIEPRTVVCVRGYGEQYVQETVAEVVAAMSAERAAIAVENPTRLALRAVEAGLKAMAEKARELAADHHYYQPPILHVVSDMLSCAAQAIDATLVKS